MLIAFVLLVPLLPLPTAEHVAAAEGAVVTISEVYGGGGNTNATYRNDYVELLNRTRQPIDLTGWTIDYASATSTNWSSVKLSGSIAPYRYFLVRMGSGGSTGVALPTPDATAGANIARAGGKL